MSGSRIYARDTRSHTKVKHRGKRTVVEHTIPPALPQPPLPTLDDQPAVLDLNVERELLVAELAESELIALEYADEHENIDDSWLDEAPKGNVRVKKFNDKESKRSQFFARYIK